MPKVQLFSDIHSRWKDVDFSGDPDVILALGDMTEGISGVEWLKKTGKRVLYVPGNHEFYDGDIEERLDELRIAAKGSDVSIMDLNTVYIDDVRFVGTTLWSDFASMDPEMMKISQKTMNDYRMISARAWYEREKNRKEYQEVLSEILEIDPDKASSYPKKPDRFNPIVAMVLHKRSLAFLSKELAAPWHGKTVVLTHHAPSLHSLTFGGYFTTPDVRDTDKLIGFEKRPHKIGAYASSLEYFFANHSISFWFHGHIHHQMKYRINAANVWANPAGYHHNDNPEFHPKMIFDINDESLATATLRDTLDKCLALQGEFSSVLKRAIVSWPTSAAKGVFKTPPDVLAFAKSYNQIISILLTQSKKDCQRADFIADPINSYKISDILTSSGLSWEQAATRCIADMLSIMQANESKTTRWLLSLNG